MGITISIFTRKDSHFNIAGALVNLIYQVQWSANWDDPAISTQQILFFLRKISYLHALLEPTLLFIFMENSYLHDY